MRRGASAALVWETDALSCLSIGSKASGDGRGAATSAIVARKEEERKREREEEV